MLDIRYSIMPNQESGESRFDIQLMPHSDRLPGTIIKLKTTGRSHVSAKSDKVNDNLSRLNALAVSAFDQIQCGQYDVICAPQALI